MECGRHSAYKAESQMMVKPTGLRRGTKKRLALFWDVTQCQGQEDQVDILTPEDGTHRLSQNIST